MYNDRIANSRVGRDRAHFVHLHQGKVKAEDQLQGDRGYLPDQSRSFDITDHDVVLLAVPMTDSRWFNLFEACVGNGAHVILPGSGIKPDLIAKTIREEGVTVLATTSNAWSEICNHLETIRGSLTRIRTLIFNGKATPEKRTRLILTSLSAEVKARSQDVRAVYQSTVHRDRN